LNIIDLFSGCGGFSNGFEEAGFDVLFAVEKDLWASETYLINHPNVKVYTKDITTITNPLDLLSAPKDVDGVIGGPPCQGFSLSGDRDPKDPRNSLFRDYMRFVKAFKPKFFVMENVNGILSAKTKEGHFVKDLITSEAVINGYNCSFFKLNAVDYGTPQSRVRVFFIGIRSDLPYDSSRLLPKVTHLPATHVTVREALSDLPHVESGKGTECMDYLHPPQNEYQRWCRSKSRLVQNHISMRHTPRLVQRFQSIKFGESLADVSPEHMQRKRGDAQNISGKSFGQNNMRPYPDRPSPTIPASFQSNFIHPLFDRNYTAREGARLQSFPDHYVFKGKRTTMSWEKNLSQYQQIGNAVPPLLARAVAQSIHSYFNQLDSIVTSGPQQVQLELFSER